MAWRARSILVVAALGLTIALGACQSEPEGWPQNENAATMATATVTTGDSRSTATLGAPSTAAPERTSTPTAQPLALAAGGSRGSASDTVGQTSSSGSPCVGGNAGHTGAVVEALADVLEPKWVAIAHPAIAWQHDVPLVADDEIVVVSAAPHSQVFGPFRNLSAQHYRPTISDREVYAVYAFNVLDGAQRWRFATGGVVVGAPQLEQGRVYLAVWNAPGGNKEEHSSTIYCLNGDDGALLWRHDLTQHRVGMLTAAEGLVVLPGHESATVTALDASTGEARWTADLGTADNSLIPASVADGRVLLSDSTSLYALDSSTGGILWVLERRGDTPFGGIIGGRLLGPIVAAEGRIYWADQATLYSAAAGTGQVLWKSEGPAPRTTFRSGPSYHDGRIFIAASWHDDSSGSSGLLALDASDGSELWRQDGSVSNHLEAYPRDWEQYYPPLITANGRVVAQAGLLDEADGHAVWTFGGVHPALPWNARLATRGDYPTREAWLPNEWVGDQQGEPVLLPGFNPWLGPPAVAGGQVIGWGDCSGTALGGCEGYRLVAYGADTTPPIAVIDPRNPPPGAGWAKGTAYDYNLVDWSLALGDGSAGGWRELARRTVQIQSSQFYQPALLGELADGVWAIRLTVTDATGLTAMATEPFTVDHTKPTVTVTEPSPGATVITTRFTLSGTASDTNAISLVRVSADNGRSWLPATGANEWSLPVEVTEKMVGKDITYIVEAIDEYGNVGRSAPFTFTFPFFELFLQAGGRRLSSSLSLFVDPSTDIDGDGIDQRWENAVIAQTMPVVELDEEEQWLDAFKGRDDPYAIAYFARVTGYTPQRYISDEDAQPTYILVYIAFGWAKDWGATGLGVIDLLEAHRGDSETVTMAWRVTGEQTAELEWVRTSAHGGPSRHHGLWHAWERSCTLANIALTFDTIYGTELMCASLEFDRNGRLVLYPGEDKHAIYPSQAVCENVTLQALGDSENCGWDPLTDPTTGLALPLQWTDANFRRDDRYLGGGRWLFDGYNVGEPDPCRQYQLIDFLDEPESWRGLTTAQAKALNGLYPGEAVWSGHVDSRAEWAPDQPCAIAEGNDGGNAFCGGLEDTIGEPERCSSKLGSPLRQADDWTDAGPPDLIDYVLNARYEIAITTGDRDKAGTDALISVGLVHDGELIKSTEVLSAAETGSYRPPFVNVGSYERGDTDHVYIWETGGDVTAVRLAHDNSGEGPGWFVERIVVRDLLTGQVWAAWPQVWLAEDESTQGGTSTIVKVRPYEPGSVSELTYEVMVQTGDVSGAGTDADVSLTLLWVDGHSSGPFALDTADYDDFERNSADWYAISAQDRGALAGVRLKLSSGEGDAAWYCHEVTLRNTITGQVWVLPVRSWLGRDGGPLEVEKLLAP